MDEDSSAANDPSIHLKKLMQAGQQSAKQFDDALALAMGVAGSALSTVLAQGAGLALLVEGRRRSREMMPLGGLRRNAWYGQWGKIAALGAPVSLTFLGMALCPELAMGIIEATSRRKRHFVRIWRQIFAIPL